MEREGGKRGQRGRVWANHETVKGHVIRYEWSDMLEASCLLGFLLMWSENKQLKRKPMTIRSPRKKGFVSFKHRPSTKTVKAGTQGGQDLEPELKQRPWRCAACWIAPSGLLGLFSYAPQPPGGCCLPLVIPSDINHQSIKCFVYRLVCRPTLQQCFLD